MGMEDRRIRDRCGDARGDVAATIPSSHVVMALGQERMHTEG
jgi:hypothetical protein